MTFQFSILVCSHVCSNLISCVLTPIVPISLIQQSQDFASRAGRHEETKIIQLLTLADLLFYWFFHYMLVVTNLSISLLLIFQELNSIYICVLSILSTLQVFSNNCWTCGICSPLLLFSYFDMLVRSIKSWYQFFAN